MAINELKGIVYDDPVTYEEREEVAGACMLGLELSMPALVDGMDDEVNLAYGAHPDRLFIVGTDGKIAYAGGPGPGGFRVDELAAKLAELLPETQVSSLQ